MMKKLFLLAFMIVAAMGVIEQNLIAESVMNSLVALPGDSKRSDKDSNPMTITANSMDIDVKNNIITLVGNVHVEDSSANITSDKMLVYLQDNKQQGAPVSSGTTGSKSAKAIVCLGDVVILQKNIPEEEAKNGQRKATAGRADYDTVNGIIILTENPILYQGDNYIKGNRIILWRNSDRMKVESGENESNKSVIVLDQNKDTSSEK
jgi:lipopolysaccharide export system protein LptA